MKNVFFLLALLFTVSLTFSQTAISPEIEPPITMRYGEQVEINQDSMGIAFLNSAVGLISNGAKIFLFKGEGEDNVFAVVGNSDNDGNPIGIRVSADGETVFINSDIIVIKRKVFSSHAEADAELVPGEEYFLSGDRLTYHKP